MAHKLARTVTENNDYLTLFEKEPTKRLPIKATERLRFTAKRSIAVRRNKIPDEKQALLAL